MLRRTLSTPDYSHPVPTPTRTLVPSTSHNFENMPKSAKTRNTPKSPQPQHQQPPSPSSAPPLPSPATAVNNGPQPPVPAIATVDFAFFIQHGSPDDLKAFLELTATTPEGRNLKLLWSQAFVEGIKWGINQAKSTIDFQLRNANVNSFQEGYEAGVATSSNQPAFPLTRESAVQSDPVYLPPTILSSTQTPPPSVATAAVQADALNPLPPLHVEIQANISHSI